MKQTCVGDAHISKLYIFALGILLPKNVKKKKSINILRIHMHFEMKSLLKSSEQKS